MAGAVDVDWEEVYLGLDSDSDNAEEVPGLLDDDVEELSLLSSEPLSSPLSHVNNNSNLLMHSKHQEAEGVGAREGGGAGEEGRDFVI